MNNFIQFNKFAKFHNNKNIFFCKLDYIENLFASITKLENDVVIITGNSDFGIYNDEFKIIIKDLSNYTLTELFIERIPKNIKYWFSSNNCSNLNFIKTLPLGIENSEECLIKGHGVAWEHTKFKIKTLNEFTDPAFDLIKEYVYFNCNVDTNLIYRSKIKNECLKIGIEVENNKLNYLEYIQKCRTFTGIICPMGNGVDTHRFYEILLMGRVPILIKDKNLSIYENFFEKFPCVVVNNVNDLFDQKIKCLINDKLKTIDNQIIHYSYWEKFINEHINSMCS